MTLAEVYEETGVAPMRVAPPDFGAADGLSEE